MGFYEINGKMDKPPNEESQSGEGFNSDPFSLFMLHVD